jgi:hypothetical protein
VGRGDRVSRGRRADDWLLLPRRRRIRGGARRPGLPRATH